MKDIENIEDWYRDELDNFNVNPDKDVWNSLSDELDANMTLTDENISEWYKREVDKLEERPDYTVWEKLATKLDTSSVWDRLVVSLNQYERFVWWRNVILKSSAILLLLTGSYLTYHNYTNNNDKEDVLSENNHSTIQTSKVTEKQEKSPFNNKGANNNNIATTTASSFYNDNPNKTKQQDKTIKDDSKNIVASAIKTSKKNISSNKNNSNLFASSEKEKTYSSIHLNNLNELKTNNEPTIFNEIERRKITTEDISHIVSSSDFLVKKEKNKIVFNSKRFSSYTAYGLYARRFYIGMNAGIKKHGLITKIKKNGVLANTSQVEYLDFGGSFGATAGFILSDNFNLEASINAINTSGYKRKFNGEGYSIDEKLNLNYSTINLLVKKMNTKSTFDNKVYSTNIIGGIYASYLTNSSSSINGNSYKNDDFNTTDLGLVLGIEQDRYLSKTLVITPGIRYNQGVLNIASNNNPYESALNYSLEFNIGLKYIFLKTSK